MTAVVVLQPEQDPIVGILVGIQGGMALVDCLGHELVGEAQIPIVHIDNVSGEEHTFTLPFAHWQFYYVSEWFMVEWVIIIETHKLSNIVQFTAS